MDDVPFPSSAPTPTGAQAPLYVDLPLNLIREPSHRLRESIAAEGLGELADSIAAEGLHQPVGVRGPLHDGTYEIVFGHRRLLAVELLKHDTIAARIFHPSYDPLLASVSENLQRENLTPVEEARAVQKFLDRGEPVAAIARLFRRSPGWVAQRLALLSLPQDLQDGVHGGGLSLGVARALAHVDHPEYRAELISEAHRTGVSVTGAEVWAAHYQADKTRLVKNLLTVQEMIQARAAYVISYPCQACGQVVDYTQTEAWRFCGRCTTELRQTLQGEPRPPRTDPSDRE